MKRAQEVVLMLAVVLFFSGTAWAQFGTAFTYQGKLSDDGSPANDKYDFQFRLYDDPNIVIGSQVGYTETQENVNVYDGYFTVTLDFGSLAFNGDARWLEIMVRPWDSRGSFTPLGPR